MKLDPAVNPFDALRLRQLRKGQSVQHLDYGAVIVVRVERNGGVVVRDAGGITGTTTIRHLRP